MTTSELLNVKVKDVMSTDLKVAKLDDTMETMDKILSLNNINHIPVVNEIGNLKGIVTRNDIELLKDWGTELGLPSSEKRNIQLMSSQLASERMSQVIITVKSDDTMGYCAKLFQENIFHALPVVDNDLLVGIITTYDMLKLAYNNEGVVKN